MKTFLISPDIPPHESVQSVCQTIRESIIAAHNSEDLLEHIGNTLRRVFNFDHIIYMEPAVFSSRMYQVWPPYKGNTRMIWPMSKEQDATVLNSYHDTMVRICEKGDFGTITISVLNKYMKEAHTDDFSLLFLRKIVKNSFIGLIGFVSFRKNAFTNQDVATIFALLETFMLLWKKICIHTQDSSLIPHNADFFSIGNLPGMQKVLKAVYKISKEDIPVVLLGETGTGKEGIANIIYRGSGRHQNPFVKINCGGIPISLMESKLFGYQKGAFTGADKDTQGCFELADTGTLLLDELGELPLGAQAQLLRVLQEKVIQRVGSSTEIPVNVRIIAATNRNLTEMVKKNKFRIDLFYRLNIFPIYVPALRERVEDIPVLLDFFILQQTKKHGFIVPPKISPSEMKRLCSYSWPGNIREMQNAVTRAVLMWDGTNEKDFTICVGKELFAGMFSCRIQESQELSIQENVSGSLRMEDVERNHIIRVLDRVHWRITGLGGAAELLDMNPSTLRARMKKLNIHKETGSA